MNKILSVRELGGRKGSKLILTLLLSVVLMFLINVEAYAWVPVNIQNTEKTESFYYRYVNSTGVSGVPVIAGKITNSILPPSGQTLQDITLRVHPILKSSHVCRLDVTENLHVNISVVYYDNSVENRTLIWTVEEGTTDGNKVRSIHNLSNKAISNIPNIKNGYRIKEIKYSISQGRFYFDYYRSGAGGNANHPTMEGELIVSSTHTVALDLDNLASKGDLSNLASKSDLNNLASKSDLNSLVNKSDLNELTSKINNMQTVINALGTNKKPEINTLQGLNKSTATKTDSIQIEALVSNATHYRINNGTWKIYNQDVITIPISKGINRLLFEFSSTGTDENTTKKSITIFGI